MTTNVYVNVHLACQLFLLQIEELGYFIHYFDFAVLTVQQFLYASVGNMYMSVNSELYNYFYRCCVRKISESCILNLTLNVFWGSLTDPC